MPVEDVVAVASTSGTTGAPTFYAFTAEDVATTDELWGRAFRFAGVQPGDTVLHGFGLSMFLAGVPVVRALERMGARPVPVGAEAGSERLLRVADLTRPRVLACTPSYATYLAEQAPKLLGRPADELGIDIVCCAGEPGAGIPHVREAIATRVRREGLRHARRRARRHVLLVRRRALRRDARPRRRTRRSPRSSSTRRRRSRSRSSRARPASG